MNPRLKNKFGMVSNEVIRDPQICLRAKAIYSYLASYCNENNETYVGINKIASENGITQSSVKRIIAILKQHGIIKRVRRGLNKSHTTILLK